MIHFLPNPIRKTTAQDERVGTPSISRAAAQVSLRGTELWSSLVKFAEYEENIGEFKDSV